MICLDLLKRNCGTNTFKGEGSEYNEILKQINDSAGATQKLLIKWMIRRTKNGKGATKNC